VMASAGHLSRQRVHAGLPRSGGRVFRQCSGWISGHAETMAQICHADVSAAILFYLIVYHQNLLHDASEIITCSIVILNRIAGVS